MLVVQLLVAIVTFVLVVWGQRLLWQIEALEAPTGDN